MTRTLTFAMAATAALAASCAPRKAIVVGPPPAAVKRAVTSTRGTSDMTPPPPAVADDGLRMPNMLDLPAEGEFRATNPTATKPDAGSNAVISHPPTDPPSRVKPPEPKPE